MQPDQHMRRRLRRGIVTGLTALILIGCAAAPDDPAPRNIPTLNAPAWRDSAAPITLETVPAIRLLGRLDQAGAPATVFAHTVSPDGLNLAGLTEQDVIGWDLLTGARTFVNTRFETTHIGYASDKAELYGIDGSGDLRVLDAGTGVETTRANGHLAYAGVFAFAPDHDLIALGGMDGTIKVWDMIARESRITFDAGGAAISALAFDAAAGQLASADAQGRVRVWAWAAGELIHDWRNVLLGTQPIITTAFAFSPDGAYLSAVNNTDVRRWSLDGAPSQSLRLNAGDRSPVLVYSPDGSQIVTGSATDGLALWDALTPALITPLPGTGGVRMDAAFSPDGTMLVTTALEGQVTLWNLTLTDSSEAARFEMPVPTRTILDVTWTADGRLIVMFDANGAVYVWGIPAADAA
ncbi:MAG: hypothetical protein SF162_12500 [bacterium]|nr:hypothetical protein [bacterium]